MIYKNIYFLENMTSCLSMLIFMQLGGLWTWFVTGSCGVSFLSMYSMHMHGYTFLFFVWVTPIFIYNYYIYLQQTTYRFWLTTFIACAWLLSFASLEYSDLRFVSFICLYALSNRDQMVRYCCVWMLMIFICKLVSLYHFFHLVSFLFWSHKH